MYSREIDGQILILASVGFTYEGLFVLYDYETESLWYHIGDGLACVSEGPYQDRVLPELPSSLMQWQDWVAQHPDSKYLNAARSQKFKPPSRP